MLYIVKVSVSVDFFVWRSQLAAERAAKRISELRAEALLQAERIRIRVAIVERAQAYCRYVKHCILIISPMISMFMGKLLFLSYMLLMMISSRKRPTFRMFRTTLIYFYVVCITVPANYQRCFLTCWSWP